ncbi:MAG TPA: hypothetical protein VMZ66_05875 [Aeromicrobium sp.]|nr:hypothetical protein [Aeromicrobium sp.]
MAGGSQAGWWPRLVTKFRNLSDEPTSRKTVVLMEVALVAQVLLSLLVAPIMRVRVDVIEQTQILLLR